MRFWDRGGDEPNEYCPERVAALCRCEASGHAMNDQVKSYLAEIGRRGGQRSKRKLTKAQARAMVRARTAKRAALRQNDKSSDREQ